MILFLEDWAKYPGAIIDTKTNNKSFLRLAGLYKKMGIKNHAFLLALHDPVLQGVDPRSKNLSEELKHRIIVESFINPWYYFREVLRIQPEAGTDLVYLRANRANIAYIWLCLNHITSLLIMPRQTGKSLIVSEVISYITGIRANNTSSGFLLPGDSLRIKTAKKIREELEIIPDYMRLMNKKDIKNTERITVKALNNDVTFSVAQKDKKAADNLGRGDTKPIRIIDEFAYNYNIGITLPVMLSSTIAAREQAKKDGQPYYTSFATTAGKLNTPEGKFAYGVYKSALRFSEKYFDLKNEEELNEVVKKNTKKYKLILLEYNHRQLGFTDDWLRERMESALVDGPDAECDYLNKWLMGNASSPIPKNLLKIISESKKNEFNPFISKYGYVLKWYIDNRQLSMIRQTGFLTIGLDTSEALGGDNDSIGLIIKDVNTGATVGAGKYNETNLATFADFLVELLELYPRSILIPERRSSATAIMDYMFRIMIAKGMNPFKRIFNWIVQDAIKYKDIINHTVKTKTVAIETLNKYKRMFGFATSGVGETSRSLLYGNVFRAMIKYTADRTYDADLIDQLASLRIVNNRIDHGSDGHDDLVIAALLCMWFLLYGKNKELYGIKTGDVLSSVVDNELLVENDKVDKNKIEEQKKLKATIEDLTNQLRNTDNIIIAMRLFNQIKQLQQKIDPFIIKNFNIDEILNNIKIVKKLKKKNI